MAACAHPPVEDRRFCPQCGKLYDLASLKQLRIMPRFIGRSSLALEKFWATGDPNDA